MNTEQLTASDYEQTPLAPIAEIGTIEHALNYGKAVLYAAGTKFGYIGENIRSTIGRNAAKVGTTALLAAAGTGVAEMPSALGNSVVSSPDLTAAVPNQEKSTNTETTESKIHFFSLNKKNMGKLLERAAACSKEQPNAIYVGPGFSKRDKTGFYSNNNGEAWIDYPVKNNRQVLRTVFNKGKTVCFVFVETRNEKGYFVERNMMVFKKNEARNRRGAHYIDPFDKYGKQFTPGIRTATIYYKDK